MTAASRPAEAEGAGEAQIAGLLVDPATGCLKGYRWTPRHATVVDADGVRVHYTVPTLAAPLLDAALRRAVHAAPDDGHALTVHRVVDGRCDRLGAFHADAWDGGVLTLRSCTAVPVLPLPPPLVAEPVSVADVFAHWRLDASFDRTAYTVPSEAAAEPERVIVPDVALYGVAADNLLSWFGDTNRLGRNCVGFLSGLHPTRELFATARALAQRRRYPVVLVYGDPSSPDAADALETNCGLQVIAVQPGTGTTRRAHFAAVGPDGVRLCAGERGESP